MEGWSFLSKHGRVLLCIVHDPRVRLRDIAAGLGITERSAYGIVTDLTAAGYAVKQKDGRRNRYQIQAHLPLPEPSSQERTVGDVLALLAGTQREAVTDAERRHLTPTAGLAKRHRKPAGGPAMPNACASSPVGVVARTLPSADSPTRVTSRVASAAVTASRQGLTIV